MGKPSRYMDLVGLWERLAHEGVPLYLDDSPCVDADLEY